jgi:hypothetical protein
MRVLALDLGCKTGWCLGTSVKNFALGTKVWSKPSQVTAWRKTRQDRRCDPRLVLFYEWLKSEQRLGCIDKVIFEDVEFCKTRMQCQLWASWRTAIWLAFPEPSIECVPVGALKKYATGNGGAGKNGMASWLAAANPSRFTIDKTPKKGHIIKDRGQPLTDDAVDAYWLFQWAHKHIIL